MNNEKVQKLVSDIIEIMYSENISSISKNNIPEQESIANPFNAVKSVAVNVAFESDDDYVTKYICMRIVLKEDCIQRIVFSDSKNRFAILEQGMGYNEMNNELVNHLNITDSMEVISLTDKAEKAILYYSKRESCQKYKAK